MRRHERLRVTWSSASGQPNSGKLFLSSRWSTVGYCGRWVLDIPTQHYCRHTGTTVLKSIPVLNRYVNNDSVSIRRRIIFTVLNDDTPMVLLCFGRRLMNYSCILHGFGQCTTNSDTIFELRMIRITDVHTSFVHRTQYVADKQFNALRT